MSIAVTGATGNLGQLVVESLIGRGTAASDIVAVVRNPQKAESLAGVTLCMQTGPAHGG